MRAKLVLAAVLTLAAFAITSAEAQSLKARQRMEAQEKELVGDVESTNKACESSIAVKFDWAGAPEDKISEMSPAGYCDGALSGIRRICDDPTGKKAVQAKIKTMTCGFGSARSIALKDGAIDYKINFDSSNDGDYVYEFLQNQL